MSINRGIKMKYIYTREYHSAIKGNKTEPFAKVWMGLDSVK